MSENEEESANEGDGSPEEAEKPTSWLEWTATIISCVLIAALAGILVHDAMKDHSPAAFKVITGKPDIVGDSYRIPVRVYNTGDASARTVMVHVEAAGPDTVFVETDLTLDWLPGKSSHSVIGYLKRPTAPHVIRSEVRGYSDP